MRELFTTVDETNGGLAVGFVIGLIYLFGFIYYIYKKFLSIIFEDLMCLLDGKENEEMYRPILYSLLNSMQYLILCFFSTFSSQSDLGVAAIVGSDAFNLFFILALILIKYPDAHHGILDTWVTFRDTTIYFAGLITMLLCLYSDWVKVGTSLVLLAYYILNIIILKGNSDIKEKIMEWLSLNNEDNEFNSDEQFQYKKRRFSITQLKESNCVDLTDPNLLKRFNRMEVQLALQFGSKEPEKKARRHRIMKVVYTTMFAIKNQIKFDRQKRSEFYISMYKPKTRNLKALSEEQKPFEQPQQQEEDQDDHPLIQNDSNPMDSVKQEKEPSQPDKDIPEEGPTLKMPPGLLPKLLWIIFFPIHLILYMQPNYIEDPIPKKLVLCFFINSALLCGCYFLIDWWAMDLAIASGIPIQIIGIILLGSMLSLQFMMYNLEVAKEEKQLEFTQSFFQTAICKISVCPGLPWILRVLVELKIDIVNSVQYQRAFAISIAVFAGLIFMFLLIAIFKRFRFGAEDGAKLLVLYCLMILVSTIIIALDILA